MNHKFQCGCMLAKSLVVFCFVNLLVACGGGSNQERAEKLVEEFYTYYIENYPNLNSIKEDVASKYLTKEYAEDFLSYISGGVDVLAGGTLYSDGKKFIGTFKSAQSMGNNEVKAVFDNDEGGQFTWIITIVEDGSDCRISKVEVSSE